MVNYEVEENNKYTKEEIDKIVEDNRDKIIKFCKEEELEYASSGKFNQYESMRVLFDLNNKELYPHVIGQGLSMDIYNDIEDGFVIEVYRFEAGVLEECAMESLYYSSVEDGEAEVFYKKYKNEEITEDEYLEKYDEVIEPWISKYYEITLDDTVEIDINYLNAC